jgi:hypothetical protein
MRNHLIAMVIFGGLLTVAAAPGASAAPVPGATAGIAVGTSGPAVEQVYWWRGRAYPYYWGGRGWRYYWGGRYYANRGWRHGRWYYY